MENCLLTKLKVSVNNPDLRGFDEVLFRGVKSGSFFMRPSVGNTIRATIIGDGYFDINGTHTTTHEFQSTDSAISLVSNGDSVDVKCNNRDKIYAMTIKNINLDDCKYLSSFAYFMTPASPTIGDIGNLHNTSLIRLQTGGAGIYGDINQLPTAGKQGNWWIRQSNCHATSLGSYFASFADVDITHLTVLISDNPNITGTIEGIVSACVDAGRANKSFLTSIFNTGVTFGGSTDVSNAEEIQGSGAVLKWTDKTHIIYQCGSDADVADTSKNVHIFAKGATAEQISSWESQGNTVHVIS